MARRVQATSPNLRGSHGRILNLIAPGGTRPSVLADGAWISKQAIGRRIQEMEVRGLVTIGPDPTDRRAVIVRRTAEGDRLMTFTRGQIADLEAELAAVVGGDRYAAFRAVLDDFAGGYLPEALRTIEDDTRP